nr:terminase small subunit [Caudoviricetes sp.]
MKKSASLFQRAEEWISKHGLIEYGGAQLQDFCKELGINDKTYRRWLVEEEDFKQAIERAKEFYKQSLTHELHETLSMVATGYEREETETEYRPNPKDPNKPTITKMKKKKVFYQPNVGAAIFLITNLDPEHYQNKQNNNVTLKDDTEKEMTIDEINKEIERIKKIETKG